MFNIIERYMNKLSITDVDNFAKKNNITLNEEELNFTYQFIKKNWQPIIANPATLNLERYKEKFSEAGITYFYTLIDDAVARVMRSEGGFVWALKNYDGDVMSDMISAAFGAMSMMSSVLVTEDGNYEYEAAHGTVTRHYYKWREGQTTSTNPIATIYAWTGALNRRGEIDGNSSLSEFAKSLENACMKTISDGIMTGDLAALCGASKAADTLTFLKEIRARI